MSTNVVSEIIPYLYKASSIPNAINMFLMNVDTEQRNNYICNRSRPCYTDNRNAIKS